MSFKSGHLFLALASAFLGSVKGTLVSQIKSLGPIEIFGLRSVGATCFMLPVVTYNNFKIWYDIKTNILLLLRSVIGNIAVCAYYFGFVYLPIAEASVLFYSTPVFTMIMEYFVLEERCSVTEIIATFFSALGVGLVCVPEFSEEYSKDTIKGVIGSLTGAVAQALALVIARKLTHIPSAVVSLWWAVVGIVFSSTLCCIFESILQWKCGLEAIYIILIGVIGFISELCLVYALTTMDAVLVSITLTSEIIWAFLLQNYINHEIPSLMSILGGVAITFSLSLPSITKCLHVKSEKLDVAIEATTE